SLGYDFVILLFPIMVFLTGLPKWRTIQLLLGVTIGFNLHFNLIQGGTTRLALVSLFWLPAGLAIWGIARAVEAGGKGSAGGKGAAGGRGSERLPNSCGRKAERGQNG